MVFRVRNAVGVLAIAALAGMGLLGTGCGGGGDDGSERAVEWRVDPPVGPRWVRVTAEVKACSAELPRLDRPTVEYTGNRVEIELRVVPAPNEEDQKGCLLSLLGLEKTITFNRDLDELVLYDASTDPPEKRWPRER